MNTKQEILNFLKEKCQAGMYWIEKTENGWFYLTEPPKGKTDVVEKYLLETTSSIMRTTATLTQI